MKKLIVTIWMLTLSLTPQITFAIPGVPSGSGSHGPTDYRSDTSTSEADWAEEQANEERIRIESLRPEDLHNENVAACGTNSDCVREEEQRYETELRAAREEEGASAPVTEITEEEAERRARLERENMRPEEVFAEDCYGYPQGDSQDSSDFALKIDCLLKTSDQDNSYFRNDAATGGTSPFEKVVIKAINTLMVTIGSVSMLLIVVAGFMMITSPGNENQRSKATEILTSAIIALVISFASYIIVNAVVGLFF